MKTEHLIVLGLGTAAIVFLLVPKGTAQPPPNGGNGGNGGGEAPGANIIIEVS